MMGERVLEICREYSWNIQQNTDQHKNIKKLPMIGERTMLKDYKKECPELTKAWNYYQFTITIAENLIL